VAARDLLSDVFKRNAAGAGEDAVFSQLKALVADATDFEVQRAQRLIDSNNGSPQ
jgi:hypothetical protein